MAHDQPGDTAAPPRGARTLCPVLVGRERELDAVRTVLDGAARGAGAAVVLRGEAGIGKTRLAREAVAAARARSMTTLVGRSLQHGQAPYRPLTEALFAAARAGPLPDTAELRPFRHALGTIVPDWREEGRGGEESSVVLGEGVLRLARALGGTAGTLLVVEDLHWADADTLAVVEYLADNVGGQPAVLLVTVRATESPEASDLVTRLESRGAARVVDLGRLPPAEVAVMAAQCAGAAGTEVGDEVFAVVARRSEGLPLLVEELLSVPASGISQAVPGTFADAVARRLEALRAESRLVVECAAVLGRRFDWRLLAAVTALPESGVRQGLADAVGVQLLRTDADGGFSFRHALTRDAVLAGLLPPTRIALARRAARAVDGEDDARVLLAADLWCAAGEPDVAARGLVAAGRRAVARGALVTAERLLERARAVGADARARERPFGADARARLCADGDGATRTAAAEALTEALALAAKVDAALAVGAEALALLDADGAPAARRARLHLVLARAAEAAARRPLAREHLGRARDLGREAGDERLLTAVDALAAHVAMGELRYDDAERLAAAAAERAVRLELPEVAYEALEVLGRRERLRDLDSAAATFEQAYAVAREHDLALSSMRALHELGTIDMLQRSSPTRLLQASELAYRAGALSLAATVDLQLVGLHAYLFELDAAVEAGRRAIEVAAALGLTEVRTAALLQLGFAHALAGRRDSMEDAVEAALAIAGDHPESLALAWGHARATASLFAEDRTRALEELTVALSWARRVRGVTGSFTALSALLRVVSGAGPEAVDEIRPYAAQAIPINQAIVGLAEAVLDARAGDPERARTRVAAADAVLRASRMDGWRHLAFRLLAEPALDGGWGEPHRWLTDALTFFRRSGHDRVAAACRDLLRRAGQPLPRGEAADVPEPLRAAGVTGRELEVLGLLGERLSNREIAQRLYLSPRTVEKHVERLLHKTGVGARGELGRLARELRT
ncbi:MAG TPA: AAA family ATPase [Pseudonocardia sp.]|nr:AAA family ATPase [Pseudonocardia sp.]